MPRMARKKSESGFMHLITRGVGKQVLFVNREDYLFFLAILKKFRNETNTTICAYCLMDNHVHLLVKDESDSVSLFMQKLNGSYAGYFNHKYERSGHLFQDRFQSEAVESDEYLVTVFRYILNNPRKAGICSAADYEWNSYNDYGLPSSYIDTSFFEDLIGKQEEYACFIAMENDDECMEYDGEKRNDEWAKSIIRKSLGIESGTMLQSWEWKDRNAALKLLKGKGLKIRQIERLTGINRGVIQKA